jgi:integrase
MGRPKKEFPPEPKDHHGKKRVWWNGQWHHLGLISEPEVWRAEFARLISLWSVDPTASPLRPRDYLVVALFEDYLASADSPAGAKQRERIGRVTELLVELHGTTPAAAFGPKEFRAWQRWLCNVPDPKDPGRARFNATSVRDFRNVVKAVWKWAAATERLPAERWQALRAVAPPRRDEARAPKVVAPADPAAVEKVIPKLPPAFRVVVQLLRRTAARPTEILTIRPGDLDRTGDVWVYTPRRHKGTWRGRPRAIHIGTDEQRVLAPWLDGLGPDDFVFTAARSEKIRSAERWAAKKKKHPSHKTRAEKKRKGQVTTERYTYKALLQGVQRVCRRVGVAPFTSYQLRHLRGTEIRARHGLEAARAVLGQSYKAMADHYTKAADADLAEKVARGG